MYELVRDPCCIILTFRHKEAEASDVVAAFAGEPADTYDRAAEVMRVLNADLASRSA